MSSRRDAVAGTAAGRVAVAVVGASAVAAGILVLVSVPAAWRARTTICAGADCPPGSLRPADAERLGALGLGVDGSVAVGLAMTLLVTGTALAVAGLLLRGAARSGPGARGAITAAAALTAIAVGFPQFVPALVVEHPGLGWLGALVDASVLLLVWWIAAFPDGRLRGGWGRALVVVATAWVCLSLLSAGTDAAAAAAGLGTAVVAGLAVATITVQLATGPRDARRMARGTYGVIGAAVLVLGLTAALQGAGLAPVGSAADVALQVVLVAAFLAVPVAVAASVLRRGLWGAAAPIARVVAAAVSAVAAVAVFLLGAVVLHGLGAEPAVALTLPAAVAAVLLPPVDGLALRAARRALTGSEADRRRVLSDLAAGLSLAATPELAPERITAALAGALGVRSATIRVGDVHAAQAGASDTAGAIRIELVHAGRTEGVLLLEPRRAGGGLDPALTDALDPVAAHLAAVLHGRRLADELEATRRALVAAREDERRRVRDDLHDELGPTLAAAVMTLGAAEREAARDPDAAVTLVAETRAQLVGAVEDVRRIVRGLRPPALDDVGLAEALRNSADALSGPMRIEVTADVPPALPAAVESAAYAIALEAMANAVRHSGGTRCSVSIAPGDGDGLVVRVDDDGRGPTERAPGVGMSSMDRRARELGGALHVSGGPEGTTVHAVLPRAAGRADGEQVG